MILRRSGLPLLLLMEDILPHLGYHVNNGVFTISADTGFLPSTVSLQFCAFVEKVVNGFICPSYTGRVIARRQIP